MDDEQLDRLVASTATVSNEAVTAVLDRLDGGTTRQRIAAAEMNQAVSKPTLFRHRHRRTVAVAAVAVVVAMIVGIVSVGDNKDSAWAAPLVEFAESSPLLLLDADGWEMYRADETEGSGEINYTSGDGDAELHWYSTPYEERLADREASGTVVATRLVADATATIIRYDGTNTFTALWADREYTGEFRALAKNLAAFELLLDSIKRVDVDTWLSAMPDSVIDGTERSLAIEQMLADIPLPDAFDASTLTQGPRIRERYHLGARVVGAVSCAWIEQWLDATKLDDDTLADEAVQAMSGVNDWAIVKEMNQSGDHNQFIAELAKAMAAGDRSAIVGEDVMIIDNIELNRYQAGLGCWPSR